MPETSLKLLIVDDEPATRTLLAEIFGQMGHSVQSAEDGFSALERIREVMPDVLLSDLNMPGMSGFELLSVIRRRLPGIYVIATSGAYSGNDVPQGIAADAFYEKATSFRSLVSMLEIATRTQAARERIAEGALPIWISRTNDEPPGETDRIRLTSRAVLRSPDRAPHTTKLKSALILLLRSCSIRHTIAPK